jgi:hypothetical protein
MHSINGRDRAIGFDEGRGRLGRTLITVVFGMVGYMCVCQPYPTHAWHTSGIGLVDQ